MALHLQRHVDQSLGIALREVEALEVFARQGEIAGMTAAINHQLPQQHVACETQSVLREVVIDVAVDLVLVDMLRQQL